MGDNGWSSFMQSRQARKLMYALCIAFCIYYVADALMEMLIPERANALIQTLGETTFYLMDIGRAVACTVTAIAFGRMLYKVSNEEEDEE